METNKRSVSLGGIDKYHTENIVEAIQK